MKWKFNEKSKYKKVLDKVKEEKRADIHSFHRYFGKLIPAIPRAYIELFTKKGDTVKVIAGKDVSKIEDSLKHMPSTYEFCRFMGLVICR